MMVDRNDGVVVGIRSYQIEQGLSEEGRLVLDLIVINPYYECETYASFIEEFNQFLMKQGYWGTVLNA